MTGATKVVLAALIAVILALALALVLVLTGAFQRGEEEVRPMTVSGTLRVTPAGGYMDECFGPAGMRDIQEGTQVVVRGPDGKTLGTGELERGVVDDDADIQVCVMPFEVASVESGLANYSVEVARRGEVFFKEVEARTLVISLAE